MAQEVATKKHASLDWYQSLNDEELFQPDMLEGALTYLEKNYGSIIADVNTEEGRKEINKVSRAIGGAIKRFDDRRKNYVAELKAKPKAIDDLFRETFRKEADALKERIRAPLDEWTENQRAADEETMRLLGVINEPIEIGTSTGDLAKRIDELKCLDLPDWLNPDQRETLANALPTAIQRLETAHAAAVYAEGQAAELEELRRLKAENERKEREAQIAKEAAERARAEAEAKAQAEKERAERERIAAEQAAERAVRDAKEAQARAAQQAEEARQQALREAEQKRLEEQQEQERQKRYEQAEREALEANREHRATIHRAIVADLMNHVLLNEDDSKAVVMAVARGKVPNLEINYG
jgi:pyruvate/2-oxoglutarate dehydrogenase complex dihydrolipoamide acyltransferase (E2) component